MDLLGTSVIWSWTVPGYFLLIAFGMLGVGVLGGAYIPNYIVGTSSPGLSTRNMSTLMMTSCACSFASSTHGAMADHFGFQDSFIFALTAVVVSPVSDRQASEGPGPRRGDKLDIRGRIASNTVAAFFHSPFARTRAPKETLTGKDGSVSFGIVSGRKEHYARRRSWSP